MRWGKKKEKEEAILDDWKVQSFQQEGFVSMKVCTDPLFVQPAWLHASSDNSTLVIDQFFNIVCVCSKFSFSLSSLLMPWYNPIDSPNILFTVTNIFGYQIRESVNTAENTIFVKDGNIWFFILWGRRRQEVSITTHLRFYYCP